MSETKKFSWPSFFGVIGGIAVSQTLMLLIGRNGLIGIFVFCCVAGVGFWMGRQSAFKEITKNKQQYTVQKTTIQRAVISFDKKHSHTENIYGEEITSKHGKTYSIDSSTGDVLDEDGSRMDYIDRLRAGLES